MIQFLSKREIQDFIKAGKSHEIIELQVDESLTEEEQMLMLLFAILDSERSAALLDNLIPETAIRILKNYLSSDCFENALHEKFMHYLQEDINQILTLKDQENAYCMIVKGKHSGKSINLQAQRMEKVIETLARTQRDQINLYLDGLAKASEGHALASHIIRKHLEPIEDWTMHSKIHMHKILKAMPNHYIPALLNSLNTKQKERIMGCIQSPLREKYQNQIELDVNKNPQKMSEAQEIVREVIKEMYKHGEIMY